MITITYVRYHQKISLTIWDVDWTNRYPKSYKVYKSTLYYADRRPSRIFTEIVAYFEPNEVNKGKNETGLNRLKKFIQKTREFGEVEIVESEYNRSGIHELPQELL